LNAWWGRVGKKYSAGTFEYKHTLFFCPYDDDVHMCTKATAYNKNNSIIHILYCVNVCVWVIEETAAGGTRGIYIYMN